MTIARLEIVSLAHMGHQVGNATMLTNILCHWPLRQGGQGAEAVAVSNIVEHPIYVISHRRLELGYNKTGEVTET